MRFDNPTPLRLGMQGTLFGRKYRVAGRVVMGMDDGGTTYYWNEFNLVGDDETTATLVYEETEEGGAWRLFTLFEPEGALTAEDAASKRVGDRLNLDGTDVRVTLVDESRVYYIEGRAPEGVEVGDVAHYFNAEAHSKMQVVSWTGDEVEYYHGVNVPVSLVASAFNLSRAAAAQMESEDGDDSESKLAGASSDLAKSIAFALVGATLIAALLFALYAFFKPGRRPSYIKVPAAAVAFKLGSKGTLDGRSYTITSHSLVEIARVDARFDRHEYELTDDQGNTALLVCGLEPRAKQWALFTPLALSKPLTPVAAAALKAGDAVEFEDKVAVVREMFQATVQEFGTSAEGMPSVQRGDRLFGLGARPGNVPVMLLWNTAALTSHRGVFLPADVARAAFDSTAKR